MKKNKILRRRLYLGLRRLTRRHSDIYRPHGVPVRIPHDADLKLRYRLARGRPYEAAEAALIRAHLPQGSPVIELGGCMGVISALIRDVIGPDPVHVVVEADPHLAAICRPNAEAAAAPGKAEVVVAAIDYSGAATVTFASGKNAHVGHVAGPGETGITVPALRLCDLTARLPAGPFALICDIEGAETAMIAAEAAMLPRLSVLILETHPMVYPGGQAELDAMLAGIRASGMDLVAEAGQVVCFRRARPHAVSTPMP